MIKVGIAGATGYTGIELLRILFSHPEAEITAVTSEKFAGKKVEEVFPFYQGRSRLTFEALSDETLAKKCDVVFSCLPHASAMSCVPRWIEKGLKVIDLSAGFRFRSAEVYAAWYEPHTAPHLLKKAVYGLPELNRGEIRKATLVGNPGCYPTGAILGLAPLLKAKKIDAARIIIDSKSGVTGAGRSAAVESLFSEVNDSVHAYKVGRHRHTPEIEQALSTIAGQEIVVSFTAHLIPMDRGILSTIHLAATGKTDTEGVLKILADFYAQEPFVKVLPAGTLPKTKEVRGTNLCLIGAVFDPRMGEIIVITAIDNLMKGASSQAVQNMNLICGFDETTGLDLVPLLP